MAKSGGFLAGLAAIVFSAWRQSQRERRRAEENYRTEIKKATAGSKAQADYEKLVLAAPMVKGNGRFDHRVYMEYADQFALEAFSEYLELMHNKDDDFLVLLKLNPDEDSDEGNVIVEASQAVVGHIYFADDGDFVNLLDEFPAVRARAKLNKLVDGGFQVWLDVETEPEIDIEID